MKIDTTRFGQLEVDEGEQIVFEAGLIGFSNERHFILIHHGTSDLIAWLQSVTTPGLAFPVVSAHGLVEAYPDVDIRPVAEKAGLGSDDEHIAVMAVLCAVRMQPATVNLLAPILVNSVSRKAAQVFLEGSRFSTRELFVLPSEGRPDQAVQDEAARAG